MKVIIFLALCGIASAGIIAAPAAIVSTGSSSQTRSQDGLGNYAFAYNENHATGGSSRSESGNALGQVVGSYSLGVVDGRQRVVNYVADALGFRAAISTNEPGTAPKPAASTSISSPGVIAAAPVAVAAPVVAAAPAPIVAAAPAFAPSYYAPAPAKIVAAAPAYAPAYAPAALPVAGAHYSSVINHASYAPVAAKVVAAPAFAAPALW
ncbi:adult-specific rigid cuticular protein 15.7-like [Panonychus citri]|uniref:adult-specific rigid cuticular protein 15.7-like n=1 Tax=Panonychus citri TaxID=50023 RepID=UPI0023081607|nr:adult-specific rigid cuticular protein 15.7-like [Panonychus citri]XP_053210338.1 adult-specific rigid cuticular protein 15.7-like [Panonychus citri]